MKTLFIKMAITNTIAIFATNVNILLGVATNLIMLIYSYRKLKNQNKQNENS